MKIATIGIAIGIGKSHYKIALSNKNVMLLNSVFRLTFLLEFKWIVTEL